MYVGQVFEGFGKELVSQKKCTLDGYYYAVEGVSGVGERSST